MTTIGEEIESLEAIYDTEFQVLGERDWRIKVPEHGASLRVRFSAGYPAMAPPVPSMEFDEWPADGNSLAARICKELAEIWDPGEGCVCQWVEHVKQALENREPVEVEPGAEGDIGETDQGPTNIPLEVAVAQKVGPSLLSAGFSNCGPGIYVHSDRGVTVEVGAEMSITVDGIDAEDLVDWSVMQLADDVPGFGARLLEWVTAQRSAEPGFLEDDASDVAEGLDFLPTPEELGVTRDRELHIYTWGKALRKAAPPDSQSNFNAGILNGRGGGADLRTMNGLSDEVQRNVASCGLFPRWISMVCAKIEHHGLHTVSINCTKGRHRSVAAAEILARLYYPQATLKHLTIY